MEWSTAYHRADESVPSDALDGCPTKVEATLLAVLEAVRASAGYRTPVRDLGDAYLSEVPRRIA